MNSKRLEKIRLLAAFRQIDLTVILENVHDWHNINAVLRSCDAIGVPEIFVLYTDPRLKSSKFKLGKRSSAGSRKWVKVHYFEDLEDCFHQVKQNYQRILCTHLGETSVSLFDLDLTQPTALLFGNEKEGVSEKALSGSDGNFTLPQFGMAPSLNISVACAVTLYEACRQRIRSGAYSSDQELKSENNSLFKEYLEISNSNRSSQVKIHGSPRETGHQRSAD